MFAGGSQQVSVIGSQLTTRPRQSTMPSEGVQPFEGKAVYGVTILQGISVGDGAGSRIGGWSFGRHE